MPQVHFESKNVPADRLRAFCADLLAAAGLRANDARIVADSLVQANLRGVDSHGVARLGHYLERIRMGSINPRPDIRLTKLGPAVGRIDGDHGLGQLVMNRATHEAIALAKEAGAGWVCVCNSSHAGAMAYYGLQIADADMLGIVMTHVDPMVLPHAANKPFCGTNPICLTAPGDEDEKLCLDMATSITPWNSIMNAAMEKVPIPPGWGVNKDGIDTTDPEEVAGLYPIGTYKGSGLGIMIDVLCAMFSGAPCAPDIAVMYGDMTQRRLLGGMVGAIDIGHFVDVAEFRPRISKMISDLCSLPRAEQGTAVQYPGQPEDAHFRERTKDGIPLGIHLLDQFGELAIAYDLQSTFPI